MRRIFLLSLLAIAFLGVVGLFALNEVICGDEGATVTLRNSSEQTISNARIEVWGQYCEAKLLAPGGEVTCQFQAGSDSSYAISIKTEDGDLHDFPSFGYVTHCFRSTDEIIFNEERELKWGASDAT